MSTVLGLDGKLYRNTGTYASPVWNEIPNVKDLSTSLEKGESDVSSRATGGWRATRGTLKDASVEFSMIWDPTDADFEAIRDAFLNDTPIEFLILDGPVGTSGSQGLRATMEVLAFSRGENLEEAMMTDVTIKPTHADNPPEWYEVP